MSVSLVPTSPVDVPMAHPVPVSSTQSAILTTSQLQAPDSVLITLPTRQVIEVPSGVPTILPTDRPSPLPPRTYFDPITGQLFDTTEGTTVHNSLRTQGSS